MKLSDSKFIRRSVEKARPQPRARVDASDLAYVRGVGNRQVRQAQMNIAGAGGEYEPVSFTLPNTGRRVYGWLTQIDPSGNARVEIGDGEYAIVPPDEIRRIGERDDRERIQQQLRRVMGSAPGSEHGVREDMHETVSLSPLSAHDETLQLLSLAYSAGHGTPSSDDVQAYVSKFYPTASVLEVDSAMPGRIGVALRLAEDKEAEMGPASGGEVLETLDPKEVIEDEGKKEAGRRQAIWPFGGGSVPNVSPQQAASFLLSQGDSKLIDKALQTYFDNGGGRVLAQNAGGTFNTETLLQAAMPVVQRANPSLWKTVATKAHQSAVEAPGAPEQPAENENALQPRTTELIQQLEDEENQPMDVNELAQQEFQETPSMQPPADQSVDNLVQMLKTSPGDLASAVQGKSDEQIRELAKRLLAGDATLMSDDGGGVESSEAVNVGPRTSARRASFFEKEAGSFDHLLKAGLPPAMGDIFRTMAMYRIARRGDYIVARVKWDPKCFEGLPNATNQAKNAVVTFVKAQAGVSKQGANFGIIGKIYVLSVDEKKGEANVQFSSEFAGPSAMVVMEQPD